MKRIFGIITVLILVMILLCGCQFTETTISTSAEHTDTKVKVDETRVCNLNEDVTIKTNTSEYVLKITNIQETSERNQFSDVSPAKVFLIDYEYQNIKGDSLFISEMNFKIIDEEGEIGGSYPITCKYPQEVTEGVKCKAQMALYINNESNNITLQFYDNMFNSKPDVVFKIAL